MGNMFIVNVSLWLT